MCCSLSIGDVRTEEGYGLVYVNYGRVEDFDFLETQNISVEGSIALMRYGAIYRGNKVSQFYALSHHTHNTWRNFLGLIFYKVGHHSLPSKEGGEEAHCH